MAAKKTSTNGAGDAAAAVKTATKTKRSYLKQSDVPKLTLAEAVRLPQSIYDDFAGKPTAPYQLAIALDTTPASSIWEDLTGASIAYGLTKGGSNASEIALTELGKRLVAPTEEGQDVAARAEAAIKPTILNQFLTRYNRAKFPQEKIARNVLVEMGVPADRLDRVLQIITSNGAYAGILRATKTGPFVALEDPVLPTDISAADEGEEGADLSGAETLDPDESPQPDEPRAPAALTPTTTTTPRVFITHGKNEEILKQLEELLKFGKFEPVVAKEHETVAKPVPDKVIEDMRTCSAAIIHVATEEKLLDETGKEHTKINENVLIEIGAALALYGRNFILLVPEGLKLPSNLQGLYRCDYQGDSLDYDATMKLLKAFNDFR